MKSLNLFAATAMLAVCTTASAQFTNTSHSNSVRTADTQGWNTVYVQWNPTTIAIDNNQQDDPSFTAFSLGYSRATNIARNTPLFIEYGLGVQYYFTTIDHEDKNKWAVNDYDLKYNMLSVKVPVNITYKWHISNSSIDILPFAGLSFRFNILGKKKPEAYGDGELNLDKDDYNLFDKDDMKSKDATWKRFQVGWHIGVNARFNEKLLLGLSYGTDFSEIVKKTKLHTTSITLGYCF